MANQTTYVFGADDKELKTSIKGLKENFGSLNIKIQETEAKLKTYLNKSIEIEKTTSVIKKQADTVEALKKEVDDLNNADKKNNVLIKEKNKELKKQKAILTQLESQYTSTNKQNNRSVAQSRQQLGLLKQEATETKKQITANKTSTKTIKAKEKATTSLANATIRYLRWAGTVAGVVYAGQRAWQATLGTGLEVNKMVENNTLGIAALIAANTKLQGVSEDGLSVQEKAVVNAEKFRLAQSMSADTMDALRKASVKTYATFPQLTEIFQQAIGQTTSMGKSFGKTTDEIIKNTIDMSQNLSNIAGAIGMPMDRVREEIRSMLSGNASTDSLISTMLFGSPSEANKAIRNAKARSGQGMVELVNSITQPFKVLSNTKTYTKELLALEDAWSNTMKTMVKDSGLFKDLTDVVHDLAVGINSDSESMVEDFNMLYSGAKEFLDILENFAVPAAIVASVFGLSVATTALSGAMVALTVAARANPLVAIATAAVISGYAIREWTNEYKQLKAEVEETSFTATATAVAGKTGNPLEAFEAQQKLIEKIQQLSKYQEYEVTDLRTSLIGAYSKEYNDLQVMVDSVSASVKNTKNDLTTIAKDLTLVDITKLWKKEQTKDIASKFDLLSKPEKLKADARQHLQIVYDVLSKSKDAQGNYLEGVSSENKKLQEDIERWANERYDREVAKAIVSAEKIEAKRLKSIETISAKKTRADEKAIRAAEKALKLENKYGNTLKFLIHDESVRLGLAEENKNQDLESLSYKIEAAKINIDIKRTLLQQVEAVRKLRKEENFKGANKALYDYNQSLKVTNSLLESMTGEHLQNLERSFTSFFDSQSSNFRDFGNLGKSIIDDIGNQLLKQQIVKPLTSAVGSVTSGIFDSILGFEQGGFTAGGTKQIAGVVHGGEYVAPASQVKSNPNLFSALNSSRGNAGVSGASNISGVRGYDAGGFAGGDVGSSFNSTTGNYGGYEGSEYKNDDSSSLSMGSFRQLERSMGLDIVGDVAGGEAENYTAKALGALGTVLLGITNPILGVLVGKLISKGVDSSGLTSDIDAGIQNFVGGVKDIFSGDFGLDSKKSSSSLQSFQNYMEGSGGGASFASGTIESRSAAIAAHLEEMAKAHKEDALSLTDKLYETIFGELPTATNQISKDWLKLIDDYTKQGSSALIETVLTRGDNALYGGEGETNLYPLWKDYAASINVDIMKAFEEEKTARRKISFISGDTKGLTAQYAQQDYELVAQSMGINIATITVENFSSEYQKAMSANFTPETFKSWDILADTFNSATKAMQEYQEQFKQEEITRRKISFLTGDSTGLTAQYAQQDYELLAQTMGINVADLTAENFSSKYEAAIAESFTPETFIAWGNLASSFDSATKAMEAYQEQFKQEEVTRRKISLISGDSTGLTARYAQQDYELIAQNMGIDIATLTAENFSSKYEEAISASFTPETFNAWGELADSFSAATEAMKEYQEQFEVLNDTATSIRSKAFGGASENAEQNYRNIYSKANFALNNNGDASQYISELSSSASSYADYLKQSSTSKASYDFESALIASQLESVSSRGISAFANGGIVTKPTVGLIGEAGYKEAVIPLKNPNDPLNNNALVAEIKALRKETAFLNKLVIRLTADNTKQLSTQRAMLDIELKRDKKVS